MNLETFLIDWLEAQKIPGYLSQPISYFAALLVLVIAAIALGLLIRFLVGAFLRRWASRTETLWDDYLFERRFFHQLSWAVPSVVSYFLLRGFFPSAWSWFPAVSKIFLLFMTVTVTSFLNRLLTNFEEGYRAVHTDRRLPLRSYVQIVRIFLFLVASILLISILLDQQPWGVLSGIGAVTAILVLVFKDALLGFVASLQINSSNMFRLGDWIEMPGQGVEGEIVDISLNVVTVRNAENTVFSLPTYNLVSSTVKNWRTVAENGARRLRIALPLDARTIAPADQALRDSLSAKGLWIFPDVAVQDPWGFTNVEAFRHFAQRTLEAHPDVKTSSPIVVRILDPVGRGVVVEMLFYTPMTQYPAWANLNSRLLAYFLGASGEFGLRLFQDGYAN